MYEDEVSSRFRMISCVKGFIFIIVKIFQNASITCACCQLFWIEKFRTFQMNQNDRVDCRCYLYLCVKHFCLAHHHFFGMCTFQFNSSWFGLVFAWFGFCSVWLGMTWLGLAWFDFGMVHIMYSTIKFQTTRIHCKQR